MSPGHIVFFGEKQCREQKKATGATVESQCPGNRMDTSEKSHSGGVTRGLSQCKAEGVYLRSLQDCVSRNVDNRAHPCSSLVQLPTHRMFCCWKLFALHS